MLVVVVVDGCNWQRMGGLDYPLGCRQGGSSEVHSGGWYFTVRFQPDQRKNQRWFGPTAIGHIQVMFNGC